MIVKFIDGTQQAILLSTDLDVLPPEKTIMWFERPDGTSSKWVVDCVVMHIDQVKKVTIWVYLLPLTKDIANDK